MFTVYTMFNPCIPTWAPLPSCVWCTLILLPFFCQDLLDLFFSQEILNAKRWLSKPLFPNTVPGSKKERIFHFHYWCSTESYYCWSYYLQCCRTIYTYDYNLYLGTRKVGNSKSVIQSLILANQSLCAFELSYSIFW